LISKLLLFALLAVLALPGISGQSEAVDVWSDNLAAVRGGDSTYWSEADHLAVVRAASAESRVIYMDEVIQLDRAERLTLLVYDRCAGRIDSPARTLGNGVLGCRASTSEYVAQNHRSISRNRLVELLGWRDAFYLQFRAD
jgi:hypothetical protein